jgi:putative membrane protein
VFEVTQLPTVNAALNGIAATLLAAGYVCIRRGRVDLHRRCMLAAFATSALFLVSYVAYHAQAGSRPFTGEGAVRVVYFTVLVSHIVLAAAILPLAIVTLRRGLRRDDARHVAIARWTLPIWLYVSVTGVVVYWMLYRL